MLPRFRDGEVVRVERLEEGWNAEHAWVVGQEGVVHSISSPNEDGTSWLYLVWIDEPEPTGRVLWEFDQESLTPLGMLEGEHGRRESIPASSARELHDEIYLHLVTDIRDEEAAQRVAAVGVAALRSLVPITTADVEVERHWHDPFSYVIELRVEVEGDVLAAFDRIVGDVDSGWASVDDDGWRCDTAWSQRDAEPGTVFLAPEVEHAAIGVIPWDTVERRPPAQRRLAEWN